MLYLTELGESRLKILLCSEVRRWILVAELRLVSSLFSQPPSCKVSRAASPGRLTTQQGVGTARHPSVSLSTTAVVVVTDMLVSVQQ